MKWKVLSLIAAFFSALSISLVLGVQYQEINDVLKRPISVNHFLSYKKTEGETYEVYGYLKRNGQLFDLYENKEFSSFSDKSYFYPLKIWINPELINDQCNNAYVYVHGKGYDSGFGPGLDEIRSIINLEEAIPCESIENPTRYLKEFSDKYLR